MDGLAIFMNRPISDSEIRLVKFHPLSSHVQVQCKLEFADLDSNPIYTVVSWDHNNTKERRRIILDGESCSVPENLCHFLQWAQRNDKNSLFWIDALCVNVKDLAEKNRHVLRVKDICAKAKHMIIWLGEYFPQTKDEVITAFFTAELLSKIPQVDLLDLNSDHVQPQIQVDWTQIPPLFREPLQKGSAILSKLLERSWFSRAWSLRELANFNHLHPATVICGSMAATWNVFASAAAKLRFIERETDCLSGRGSSRVEILNQITLDECRYRSKPSEQQNQAYAKFFADLMGKDLRFVAKNLHSIAVQISEGCFERSS
jgi:hypothetical protein